MTRKAISTETRLLLSLATHGGSATLSEIRLDFFGRLTREMLAAALPNLADFVTLEKTRSKGSKRPVTILILTLRGRVAAEMLKPGFVPRRFTLDELKAEILERQAQHDKWALSLIADAEDASQWRRAEAERKATRNAADAKRAAKEKPEPKHPSAGRNRSEEELEQRREWAESKGFGEKGAQLFAGEFTAPIDPGRSTFEAPKFKPAEPSRYVRDLLSQTAPQAPPLRVSVVPDTSSNSLIEKIRRKGYTTRGNKVLYNGTEWIDPDIWTLKMPHVVLD